MESLSFGAPMRVATVGLACAGRTGRVAHAGQRAVVLVARRITLFGCTRVAAIVITGGEPLKFG